MKRKYIYQTLPAGEVIPEGWIRNQLYRDLEEGYIGRFDQVHPTVTHDVFIRQDRTSNRQLNPRKEWWSGEHEGYWKDSVIRMAFLTGHKKYQELSKRWIDDLISHQGADGYIGIYRDCQEPHCRFTHTGGNGELWATSRILMAMLAYYEFTDDKKVQDAAVRSARLIMEKYRDKNYFINRGKGGGVSHGIGFFEILEWLFRLTHDPGYADFAVKLYGDFNLGMARDDDLKTVHLLSDDRKFHKHGAHVAEGLFVPEMIHWIEGSDSLERASRKVREKLDYHLTPGGAMRCDEFVKGRKGTADERYEYCGIAEMISPLNRMITFNGKHEQADMLERMVFNAGQGARFPVLSGLSYLTADNRIRIRHFEIGRRESYDAAHFAAVCCSLNGGRLMPYYVEGMWVRHVESEGLTALLFGPCRLRTKVRGVPVEITEKTNYPFSDRIEFIFKTEKPVNFPFSFRRPFGVEQIETVAPENAEVEELPDRVTIRHTWKPGDRVEVRFPFKIEEVKQPSSPTVKGVGAYFRRGPLVYALPFQHKIRGKMERRRSGFYRFRMKAVSRKGWKYTYPEGESFQMINRNGAEEENPWSDPPVALRGNLADKDGNLVPSELVPLGTTIFRRVTFPVTYLK